VCLILQSVPSLARFAFSSLLAVSDFQIRAHGMPVNQESIAIGA
jgi:hypothetical protein